MLKLIRAWLRAGVLEDGVMSDSVSGTPQGSPVSPLLANIALHVLDVEWEKTGRRLGVLIRYADDFVVLCASKARAEEARDRAATVLATLGLQLNPDKTRIVRLTRGEEGFDFLGFHHHKVEAWRWPGRFYMQRWPSNRAMASITAKVREATDRRFVGYSLETAVIRLNPVLRGWGNYFRYGNSARKFTTVDSYVHMRLARLASVKHGLRRRNWSRDNRFNLEWLAGLEVYRLTGTVRRRDGACLAVNGVGKPCAGEPHARFDRGPLAKRDRDWPRWASKRDAQRLTPVNGRSASGLPHRPGMDSQRDRYPRGREPWAAVAIRIVVSLGTDTSPDAAATN